ncbi:MAG: hypothetical protein CV087_16725 [Candidatus Brocadia sp. WS118]|nr:MAG: hypothetical protein CV087_16725 [Candidatus Brocadia sp. WS118]
MKKILYLLIAFAGVLSSLKAQVPAHFDLNVQLRENNDPNNEPLRDARLDVEITILQGNTEVYKETHQQVWTNYDGYLSIQVGKGNPTQWNNIDWNALTKKIRIKGRANGTNTPYNQLLYNDDLPVAAYAQFVKPVYSKPGVGSISLFSDINRPNIELLGNDPTNNPPFLDFATNTSDADRNYVARISIDSDKNLFFHSRSGRSVFKGAGQVEVRPESNASIILKGGTPFIDFYPSITGSRVGRIISSRLKIRDDLEVNSIEYEASAHHFVGGPLRLSGSIQWGNQSYTLFVLNSPHILTPSQGSNAPISLRATNRIAADGFMAFSDLRIKNVRSLCNPSEDLELLKKLRSVDYIYKDALRMGFHPKRGFIAQEVEEIMPEAVSQTVDITPDIFQVGQNVIYDNDNKTLTVTVDSLSDLKTGEKVRLLGEQQHLVEVVEVNGTTFKVKDWPEENTREVFVYGREVDDFRTLDYDQIFTLNVSATQALIKEVDVLKNQLAAQQGINESLQNENKTLKDELRKINGRIESLAKMIGEGNNHAAASNAGTN